MSGYAQDALDADAAYRADGKLITLTRNLPGEYVNGEVVTPAPIVSTVWGLETSVTANDLGTTTQSGTLIQAGDRKLLISALAATGEPLEEPQLEDLAAVGSKVYTVKNVNPLNPGDTVVMYTLVVRA